MQYQLSLHNYCISRILYNIIQDLNQKFGQRCIGSVFIRQSSDDCHAGAALSYRSEPKLYNGFLQMGWLGLATYAFYCDVCAPFERIRFYY